MLIRNGELVKDDKDFNAFIKNLSTYPNPVVFYHPRKRRKNPSGLLETPMVFNIKLESSVETENGLEVWGYADTLVREKNNPNGFYVATKDGKKDILVTQGEYAVGHKDRDLLFFLLKKSKQLGSTFMIEDKVKEANERAAQRQKRVDFESVLWGTSSPLNDDDVLSRVASAWGVTGVDKKIPAQLKEDLEVKVSQGEKVKKATGKGWGIEDFLNQLNAQGELIRASIAQLAIDRGVVGYNELSTYYEFTESGTKIFHVPADRINERDRFFVSQITKDPKGDMWKIIKKAIITPSLIDTWPTAKEYGWLAEEEGLSATMKKEDKLAKLKEIYGEG